MRLFFRIHGELLMGDRGSNIVETAACWTIVLLLSGIYLWWPHPQKDWQACSIRGSSAVQDCSGGICTQ